MPADGQTQSPPMAGLPVAATHRAPTTVPWHLPDQSSQALITWSLGCSLRMTTRMMHGRCGPIPGLLWHPMPADRETQSPHIAGLRWAATHRAPITGHRHLPDPASQALITWSLGCSPRMTTRMMRRRRRRGRWRGPAQMRARRRGWRPAGSSGARMSCRPWPACASWATCSSSATSSRRRCSPRRSCTTASRISSRRCAAASSNGICLQEAPRTTVLKEFLGHHVSAECLAEQTFSFVECLLQRRSCITASRTPLGRCAAPFPKGS